MVLSHLSLSPPVQAFMDMIRERCASLGVEMYFGGGTCIEHHGVSYHGYFDNRNLPAPRYAVAIGRPVAEWFPDAVHESCHMEQWALSAPVWKAQMFSPTLYAADVLREWLLGKEMPHEEVIRVIEIVRELERDCEERTLRTVSEFHLPVDELVYAQKANSYLYYHTAMLATRRWYRRAPYEVPQVWMLMPTKLLSKERYATLPADYLRAFEDHLF